MSTQLSDKFEGENTMLPAFNRSVDNMSMNQQTQNRTPDTSQLSETTILTEDMLSTVRSNPQRVADHSKSKYSNGCAVLVRTPTGSLMKGRFEGYTGSGRIRCHLFSDGSTSVYETHQVMPDRGHGIVRHNGYLFRQVHTDPATGSVVVRNLNARPFGRRADAPSLMSIAASEVLLLNVEHENVALKGGGAQSEAPPAPPESFSMPLDHGDTLQFSDNLSDASPNKSDRSCDTQLLLDWEQHNNSNNFTYPTGSTVLVRSAEPEHHGRWTPAQILSSSSSMKGIRCKLFSNNQVVKVRPQDVRMHYINPKQLVWHKGYMFRVVQVQTHADTTRCPEYVVQNLNQKPFGKSCDAPSLMTIPASEALF